MSVECALLQQEKVIELINAYRSLGHLQANIDPLGLYETSYSKSRT